MSEVADRGLDSEFWHACAGSMVQMPPVNSMVFYFPQGHAEHTFTTVDFGALPGIPHIILCRVDYVRYLADSETDEVYAKMGLIPVGNNQCGFDDCGVLGNDRSEPQKKPNYYAKTLTQSDANNGGGFSVPRNCADNLFPILDYTADPPVQNVIAKDVHGRSWEFRHIYRGTPRRHLLTTGWSTFVNHKRLVAGDAIVFFKAENEDLWVGIRRARRGGGSNGNSACVGSSALKDKRRVMPESVVEAAFLAATGKPFEVVFYPRAGMPEFCVKASSVNAAIRIRWCPRMRFKMSFETEDSSQVTCFYGTIDSVQPVDPIRWPNSPWRKLQVTWDEHELLQNVKCVNPWLVQLAPSLSVPYTDLEVPYANLSFFHSSAFSPPMKRLRISDHQYFSLDDPLPLPSFSGNPLGPRGTFDCPTDNISLGIQGARHAQIGVRSSDLHLSNKLQMGPSPTSYPRLDPQAKIIDGAGGSDMDGNENLSCFLSMGNSNQKSQKTCSCKRPQFVLFGKPIFTDHQSCDGDCEVALGLSSSAAKSSAAENSAPSLQDCPKSLSAVPYFLKQGHDAAELGLVIGDCKEFLEKEDVGQTLDLSVLGSYEELYKKLEHLFGVERLEMLGHLFYHDATGTLKQAGEDPFSEFMKSAKRLTILTKPNGDNSDR